MKSKLSLLLTIAAAIPAAAMVPADTIRVHGTVSLSDSEPVDMAIVSLLNPVDSSTVAYSMTDIDGTYSITAVTGKKELLARVSGFNVARQTKRIPARSQQLDFMVEEENITLRELQVKAQKIWGSRDTLNYLVSAYVQEHDRNIGDVLKRLPGITIDQDGSIKYQGVTINHFYIENSDMLQGRYSIATEGIRPQDVATVQVLENHEHVKAMQDQVPPESAAVNLKLKDKAKGIWSNYATVGAGAYDDGPLWEAALQTMYFGKRRQHTFRYSGNDMGRTVETNAAHYGLSAGAGAKLVDIVKHGGSPIGNSNFGYGHTASLNNLAKLSADTELKYNLNYSHNLSHGTSFSRTTYVMPDGSSVLLTEDVSDRITTDKAKLQLSYEDNAERHYLCNTLLLSGNWNSGRGQVMSNAEEIAQASRYRNLSVANRTEWVNRTSGGGGFRWTSINKFHSTPQTLTVGGGMTARQNVKITGISTGNDFSTINNIRAHRWSIALQGNVNANYIRLSSMLDGNEVNSADDGRMNYLRLNAGVGPTVRYVKGALNISLHLPLSIAYTKVDNAHIEGEDTDASRVKLDFKPTFGMLWKMTNHFTIDASAGYNVAETPYTELYTSYILSNYRSLSRYRATLSDSHGANAKLKVSYKDILNGWFANASAGWNRSWSDISYGTTVDPLGHTTIEAYYAPNHSQRFSLAAYGRKDIDWHSIQIEVTATGSHGMSQLMRQSILTRYKTLTYAINGGLGFDLIPGYRVNYNATVYRSKSTSTDYSYTNREFTQQLTLALRLIKDRLSLNVSGDHTHNSALSSTKKDYYFVNAGLRLKLSKKVELNLNGDNLTNTHTFVRRSTGDMVEYYSEYHLRPISVTLSSTIIF